MYITDKITMRGILRGTALICILMVVTQILPVSLAVPDLPGGKEASQLFLHAINVCDDASDFTGFLADHPWVSASGIAPPFTGTGIAHVPPPAPGLPEGVPGAVYRPPRTALS
jgi:hypothetical protein